MVSTTTPRSYFLSLPSSELVLLQIAPVQEQDFTAISGDAESEKYTEQPFSISATS